MANRNEKFLKIIEEAESITETISKLQQEIASYDSAGQSLEQVRIELEKYLKTANEASVGILRLTNTLSGKMDEIAEKTKQIQTGTEQGFLEVINRTNSLKTMVIIAISISLVSLIIGLFV